MKSSEYNYELAFSRNLGFVNQNDQKTISSKTIGIPGMGGVGGYHLHTLARLGFKKFHIADLDHFDVHNFNRQVGARISTLGRSKVEVMKEIVLDIIPDAEVKVFDQGINSSNREEFLNGLDILVDGLDIYVLKERIALFDAALAKNIHVVTAGPFGMGTNILHFDPKKMGFSEYFNFKPNMSQTDLLARFVAGLNPTPYFSRYLKYKELIDVSVGQVPSLHVGVLAATSAMGAEVFKIALKREPVRCAPHSTQYEFYLNKFKKNWIPFGNKNPRQKLLIYILKKLYLKRDVNVEE